MLQLGIGSCLVSWDDVLCLQVALLEKDLIQRCSSNQAPAAPDALLVLEVQPANAATSGSSMSYGCML